MGIAERLRCGPAMLGVTLLASAVTSCATPPRWIHGKSGISPAMALSDYRQCRDSSEQKREAANGAVMEQLSAGGSVQPNARSIADGAASKTVSDAFDACLRERGYEPRELTSEEYMRLYVGSSHDLETLAYIMAGASADEYRRKRSRNQVYW